jgi:hypothetical protein
LVLARLGFDRANVGRLGAFLPLRDVELDGLAFAQRSVALSGDPGEVDENVLTTVLGDETEALLVAEPLNGSAQSVFPPSVATIGGVAAPTRRIRGAVAMVPEVEQLLQLPLAGTVSTLAPDAIKRFARSGIRSS